MQTLLGVRGVGGRGAVWVSGGFCRSEGSSGGEGGRWGTPQWGLGGMGGYIGSPILGGGHEGLCGEASTTDNERKANVGGWGGGHMGVAQGAPK